MYICVYENIPHHNQFHTWKGVFILEYQTFRNLELKSDIIVIFSFNEVSSGYYAESVGIVFYVTNIFLES